MRSAIRWQTTLAALGAAAALVVACGDDDAATPTTAASSTTTATTASTTSAPTQAPTTAATPVPPTATPQSSIRNVPWRDRAYSIDGRSVTVKDGQFTDNSSPSSRISFIVGNVYYGDLTKDGQDEAIVLTSANFGGSGTFSTGEVYGMVGGQVTMLGVIPGGDRGDGSFESIAIANNTVTVKRFQLGKTGSLAAPNEVRTESWSYSDGKMVEDATKRTTAAYP